MPRPGLEQAVRERWARDWPRNADVIYALDAATGERCGLIYGDPATESLPIDHLQPWRPRPVVLEVYVDPAADDREVLVAAVLEIKGLCTYSSGGYATPLPIVRESRAVQRWT